MLFKRLVAVVPTFPICSGAGSTSPGRELALVLVPTAEGPADDSEEEVGKVSAS
eukprot:CAMPEP_0115732994 /NCGR_PEP_ID=MMETSP0272-20121206/85422_1 /TAXON_ID=71861 /ORGANISM="Scrippsiella trochoidea, Strain CCMP3099" /LENGTH=53 /DNA_ID=CAMNT_0003176949 /DNA_START=40 /DNA_END=198 /DNA_ORIENTATION=+